MELEVEEQEEEEWPPAPLTCIRTISSREPVTALCVDKRTGYVVCAAMDNVIRVYDLVSGAAVATHTGAINTPVYSANATSINACCAWS